MDEKFKRVSIEDFDSLGALFASPAVWKRVWIMQEIACAPDVCLIAGKSSMAWEDVEFFLGSQDYIARYGISDAFHGPMSHGIGRGVRGMFNKTLAYPQILSHQRATAAISPKEYLYTSKLIDVLARFRFTQATDARDKVYALLGLADEGLNVTVDYSLPVRDVYISTARAIMEADGNLDLISQGPWQLYDRKTCIERLPSWVPDFSSPGESRILFAQRGIYDAPGSQSDFTVHTDSHGALQLAGYFLDKLSKVRQTEEEMKSQEAEKQMDTSKPSVAVYELPTVLARQWMPNEYLKEGISRGNKSLKKYVKNEKLPSPTSKFPVVTYESYWRALMMDSLHVPSRRIDPAADMDSLRKMFEDWRAQPSDGKTYGRLEWDVEALMRRQIEKWRFAVSRNGLYCMVPPGTQAGDVVSILKDSKTPIVLRPTPTEPESFTWVGACYVHEFMDGQILARKDVAERARSFRIV